MASLPRYPFTENGTSVLLPLHEMSAGQYLQSPDKRFKLDVQADGNLVIYDGVTPVWVATAGQPYTSGGKQIDKSKIYFYLMYYAFLNDPTHGRMWGTANSTPLNNDIWGAYVRTYLQLQNDGNLVVVDSVPVWASNSAIPISPVVESVYIPAGTTLEVDRRYVVGGTTLVFQSDGNLVVSNGPLGVLWASWTQNKGATRAVMQEDGNFVIMTRTIRHCGLPALLANRVPWPRYRLTAVFRLSARNRCGPDSVLPPPFCRSGFTSGITGHGRRLSSVQSGRFKYF